MIFVFKLKVLYYLFRKTWRSRAQWYAKCDALTWHGFTIEEIVDEHPDLKDWSVEFV